MTKAKEPYVVALYDGWPDNGREVGFQTLEEAVDFATRRPEPIIDLIDRRNGLMVRARRMVAYPGSEAYYRLFDDLHDCGKGPYCPERGRLFNREAIKNGGAS